MQFNNQTYDYFIQLVRAVIRNEAAPERPKEVDWAEIYKLACEHEVTGMVYDAVMKLHEKPQGELWSLWSRDHEKNQVIDLLQGGEAGLILENATKSGLSILPLKGYIMKTMYPKSEYRQMGDLDFLVKEEQIDAFRPMMESLGYDATDVGLEASHDVYTKLPYMEVEIHRRLLPPTEENHWHTDDIWERLVPYEDNPYLFHMTWEDYYLFHLLHFEKHYSMGGSGIRSIIDQYFLMEKIWDKLDFDYINKLLEKMNYVEFEKMCRGLANAWFGDGELTEELKEPAQFILNSGAFGTFEQLQKWTFEKYQKEQGIKTKTGFFFRRMFMERERMEYSYPSLKKHGWLLPFLWIHRLFKSVFGNWKRVKMELDEFKKKD